MLRIKFSGGRQFSSAKSPTSCSCKPLPARQRNDTTMKKLTLTSITFFLLLSLFGQNGLKNGNLFLLQKDKKTISLNSFENNKINELKSFSISEKSIYTTDQKARVAILDTAKNNLTIFDIDSSNQIKLTIPFDIKPKAVLLYNDNIFVGGEMGKEILIQYNFRNEKWYQLEIPKEVVFWGKAIDDLVVNDSLLIAIDDIVMPKYILFYHLNSSNRLELSHFTELKSNGCYEEICFGRISNEFLVLKSKTASMGGRTNHITIIKNFDFDNHSITYARGNIPDEAMKTNSKTLYVKAINHLKNIERKKEKRFLYPLYRGVRDTSWENLIATVFDDKFVTPCVAGKKLIVVSEEGDVSPCEILGKDKMFGNLRDYDLQIYKLLKNYKSKDVTKWIKDTKCKCSFECALSANVTWNFSQYPKLIKNSIRNIGSGFRDY